MLESIGEDVAVFSVRTSALIEFNDIPLPESNARERASHLFSLDPLLVGLILDHNSRRSDQVRLQCCLHMRKTVTLSGHFGESPPSLKGW